MMRTEEQIGKLEAKVKELQNKLKKTTEATIFIAEQLKKRRSEDNVDVSAIADVENKRMKVENVLASTAESETWMPSFIELSLKTVAGEKAQQPGGNQKAAFSASVHEARINHEIRSYLDTEGLSHDEKALILAGKELGDGKVLKVVSATKDSTLHLALSLTPTKPFLVDVISFTGKLFKMLVAPSDTFRDINVKLDRVMGMTCGMRFEYNGRIRTDDETVEHCGMLPGSVIHQLWLDDETDDEIDCDDDWNMPPGWLNL